MSGQGPKFVNKQFNSPIKLYSPQNVQETLERQTQVLSNGAVGIDFNQLAKPANLQNSAVLRMLEEEEARQRNGGQPSLKRVAWPPPPEEQQFSYVEQDPIQAKTRGVGEYALYQGSPGSGSGISVSSAPSPQPPSYSPQSRPQGLVTFANSASSPSPSSPGGSLRQPSSPFQATTPKGWAPVTPPATSPLPNRGQQPPIWQPQTIPVQTSPSLSPSPWQENPISPQQQSKPVQQGVQVLPSHPQTPQSWKQPSQPVFEPPPSTITLRPEPPISQKPAPVYQAQPAATMATVRGNMRGDQKWPPETVKQQTEAENLARVELAKGPAFRPRRVNKDYSGFFAQHALNSTYPGYRAPPGTQYFAPGYQH